MIVGLRVTGGTSSRQGGLLPSWIRPARTALAEPLQSCLYRPGSSRVLRLGRDVEVEREQLREQVILG